MHKYVVDGNTFAPSLPGQGCDLCDILAIKQLNFILLFQQANHNLLPFSNLLPLPALSDVMSKCIILLCAFGATTVEVEDAQSFYPGSFPL